MTDKFISEAQAKKFLILGFDIDQWKGKTYLELIPGSTRSEWCEEELIMKEVTDGFLTPQMRIDQAAKWLREERGIDIIISPKFNSKNGDRIGYFWRWSQRTDVNMNPKTHRSYESALADAINEILNLITPE